jgi:transposase InsO family protein
MVFPIEKMCETLKVSNSGYYSWLRRPVSNRAIENQHLIKEIKDIYMNSRGTYGSPRIKEELIRRNYNISRPRVARLMRKENIRSVVKKKYVVTTDSKHKYPVAPNVLKRNFTVEAPRKVWVSDITYISTQQGWVYLTVVIDLFDRKVVGWALSETMKVSDTTVPALQMAVKNRGVNSSLIFHSDRGVQYACNEFKAILKHYNIIQSTPSESLGLEKEIVGTMQSLKASLKH